MQTLASDNINYVVPIDIPSDETTRLSGDADYVGYSAQDATNLFDADNIEELALS
jgi:hypothetical protein